MNLIRGIAILRSLDMTTMAGQPDVDVNGRAVARPPRPISAAKTRMPNLEGRHMRRLLVLVVVGSAIASLFAATAAADQPTIEEQTLHRSIPNFISCPGFGVANEGDINRTVFTFTDDAGTPIRRVLHVHFTATLTNTVTGKSIPDEGNFIVTTDLTTGTTTVVGGIRLDTVAGLGLILAQAGRYVIDPHGDVVFIAGQQDFLNKNFADFCAYMAAP